MEEPDQLQTRVRRAGQKLKRQVYILGILVLTLWLLELLDSLLLDQQLNLLGIWPRRVAGLWGIFLMPLLHGSIAHLAANTIPFIVLGWLVMLRSVRDFLAVTGLTMFVTGVGLWLFGSGGAVYIGASGLIFGYLGFLLLRGYFERSAYSILIAIFVALAYGGLLLGVFPQQPGVSWEAHLLGFLGGIMAARLLARTPLESKQVEQREPQQDNVRL